MSMFENNGRLKPPTSKCHNSHNKVKGISKANSVTLKTSTISYSYYTRYDSFHPRPPSLNKLEAFQFSTWG